MTTTRVDAEDGLERRMLENVHTLMLRDKLSGRALAMRLGLGRGPMHSRLSGTTSFLYVEVRAIANLFGVTLEEIEGTLPPYDEWLERVNELRACRDSNPKPSDSEPRHLSLVVSNVRPELTLDRRLAIARPRLSAVS